MIIFSCKDLNQRILRWLPSFMKAHLGLEAKLHQELWMIIVYYMSYPQIKKFTEVYEKCVFSHHLSELYNLFENLPNPEPTVCLAGRI